MNIHEESNRCMLCIDAPCSAACKKAGINPARGIRAMHFNNDNCAGLYFNASSCIDCDAPCEKACIHPDFSVRIKEMAQSLTEPTALSTAIAENSLPSLEMDFCGVKCENPFFLGSSVIASSYDMIAKALRLGWAGFMYKTITFSEIKEVSPRFDKVGEINPFIGFRNMEQLSVNTPEEDFAIIAQLKADFPTKVAVASIMGSNDEEWATLARMAEQAGCDMVECNFSCPHMAAKGRGSDVGQNPELVKHLTQVVKAATSLPVIAKMTPNITHIEEPAIAAVHGGADALAAINTIKSITLNKRSEVCGRSEISGYSGKAIKPIAQRFVLDIRKDHELTNTPLSGIGGVETWRDALEYILLGCNNVQVCTAIMQYGYRIIDDITLGIQEWMMSNGVKSLEEVRGNALDKFLGNDHMDRNTYVLPKFNLDRCIGCGRCSVSCFDGGHQAISFNSTTRKPTLIARNCVGCHLCLLVCPVNAIGTNNRIPQPKQAH